MTTKSILENRVEGSASEIFAEQTRLGHEIDRLYALSDKCRTGGENWHLIMDQIEDTRAEIQRLDDLLQSASA